MPRAKRARDNNITANPNNLEVLTKALDLVEYAFKVTSNEKTIPKKFRFTIAAQTQNLALSAYDSMIHANRIYPRNKDELNRRLEYHRFAAESMDALLAHIEVCCKLFKFRSPGYWGALVVNLYSLHRAWANATYQQFKDVPD